MIWILPSTLPNGWLDGQLGFASPGATTGQSPPCWFRGRDCTCRVCSGPGSDAPPNAAHAVDAATAAFTIKRQIECMPCSSEPQIAWSSKARVNTPAVESSTDTRSGAFDSQRATTQTQCHAAQQYRLRHAASWCDRTQFPADTSPRRETQDRARCARSFCPRAASTCDAQPMGRVR